MKRIIFLYAIIISFHYSQNLLSQCHNVALGKPATSTGAYPEGAYLVNDNNCISSWNAGTATAPQWILIDLQDKFTINNIMLVCDVLPNCDVINYIYVSEDMNNWILVDSIMMFVSKYQVLNRDYSKSPLTNVRGCKIITTKTQSWISWAEIGLFTIDNIKASIMASGSLSFLKGDSVTLTANGDGTLYKWSTGATTKSIVVKQEGKYLVTISNSSCFKLPDNCSDTASVYVYVYTNDLSLKTFFTDTSAIVGNEGFQIPIKAKFNKDTSYFIKNYQLEVQFNASCFLPTNLTRGKIIENTIVGKNRVLKISDSNITINKNNSVLTEMIGTVLLADSIESNLHINSLEIPDKDVIIVK
ncbi:MAG: hypothetical protein HW421_4032, partial [Ignavibacteria bacterium]|nr:hypothetical protein [Ignavibacteria bacterium]